MPSTFLPLQIFIIVLAYVIESSSSTPSNNNKINVYKSITELDKYGSSPQINNARLASTLHGALTIAASSFTSNSVVVVSLQRNLPGVFICPKKGKVQIIASVEEELAEQKQQEVYDNDSYSNSKRKTIKKISAVVGSGLQSDITYIISLLRKHSSEIWERYDAIPNINRVAFDASQVLLCFMGYDVQSEIRDGTRGILSNDDGDKDETISIGRPLACNLLIMEVGGRGKILDMKLVEPSGIVSESLVGQAVGRGSKKANELLRKLLRDDVDIEELKDICVRIVREVAIEENLLSENEKDSASIICEVLCPEGLVFNRLPFLSSKINMN
mmetsp:Transcript_13707/g.15406  ORF Transcript_13707/g.15406 Transcript_13707/m.15406 type:complete len:329 (-) Transcript_13707:682-1668(-)